MHQDDEDAVIYVNIFANLCILLIATFLAFVVDVFTT